MKSYGLTLSRTSEPNFERRQRDYGPEAGVRPDSANHPPAAVNYADVRNIPSYKIATS